MAAPLLFAPKKSSVQWSGFYGGRCIRDRNPSKTFGIIREKCIAATECLRMNWKIKNVRTNVTHDKETGRPSTALTDQENLPCKWYGSVRRVTIDEVAHVLQIVHGSAYEMMHKEGFIKSVQDGSQNNSQRCINKRAWTSAKNIWIAMIKNQTS